MLKVNKEHISSVKLFDARKNTDYVWKPYRKGNFFKLRDEQKEGFYMYDVYYCSIDEIENGDRTVKGKEVWDNPVLIVKMTNGEVHLKFAATKRELELFVEKQKLKNFIDL